MVAREAPYCNPGLKVRNLLQPSASRKTQLVGSSLHASAKPRLQKAMPIVKHLAFPHQLTRTSCGRPKFFIVRFVVQCGQIHAVSSENGAGGCFYMKHRFFWEAPQGFSQTVLDIPSHWNHSLSHLDFHRLPMDFLHRFPNGCPWLSHGCPSHGFPWISMGVPWISVGSRIDYRWISMDFRRSPWISNGFPMDFRWLSNGCPWTSKWMSMAFPWMSMDFSWISHGFPWMSMGVPWISVDLHVFPTDFPWIYDGFPMDFHGFPNGCPWLFHGCPWISLGSPMDFQRFQLDSHGFRYISMDLHRST